MSEETEILKVAVQGTEIYMRLYGTGIKEALKFIKFIFSVPLKLIDNFHEGQEKKFNRQLKEYKAETAKMEMEIIKAKSNVAAGSMDIMEFMKVFGAEERSIIKIPDKSAERFKELAESHGLTYSMLPDLNYADGFFQVMIPNSQADIWNSIMEQLKKEDIERNKSQKENLEKEMEDTKKEKAEYTAEKRKMEKEGTDKTDPEHYKDLQSSIKILENKEAYLQRQLDSLNENITKEITPEEYMETNPQAFDHADLFKEMTENGIEPAGCEKISDFIKLPDGMESRHKGGAADKDGNTINPDGYIVNPDIPDIAVKREEISKDNKVIAYQYTVFETDKPLLNEMDFEMAVDNAINRNDDGEPYYMCSKNNPENYMEVNSMEEVYEDREFINTEFKVYNNGIEQKCDEFSHGKFTHYSRKDGENSSIAGEEHWQNIKSEMKEKGGFDNEIVIFKDKDSYQSYKKQYEAENGEIAKGNKISFKADALTTQDNKLMFIRQINQMAKKCSPKAVQGKQWAVIKSMDELNKYKEIAKKNEAMKMTKEQLKEEFKEGIGKEQGERIAEMSKNQNYEEKNIIEIPEDRLMVKQQEGKQPEYYIRSDNSSKVIKISEPDKIKQDKAGKKIIILGKEEHLDIIDRTTKKQLGEIRSQKDMGDFLKNGSSLQNGNQAKVQEKGGRKK